MIVHCLSPEALNLVGLIPSFLDDQDPRPAAEQFNERYVFGGWRPQQGWTMLDEENYRIKYPGDKSLAPVALICLPFEVVFIYPHGMVAIVNRQTGKFEVARMD